METPKEPPAGGNRWWSHVNQHVSGFMLISSSSGSGSDGSQTSTSLGNGVLSPFLEAQTWISWCWVQGERWRHPVTQHRLLSPSAPSLTFNVAITVLLRGSLLSWALKISQMESWEGGKHSRKWLRGMPVIARACERAHVCAFLIVLWEPSPNIPLQPLSLNDLLLSHSFTSPLFPSNCCSTPCIQPCVDFSTITASKATPTILPGFEICWPGALGESFPPYLLLFTQNDLPLPMFQVLPPHSTPFCTLGFLQKTQQC